MAASATALSRVSYLLRNQLRQGGLQKGQRLCSSEASSNSPAGSTGKTVPVLTGERGINKVTLIGRVGRKPEVRGTEDNPVTIFSLATSQSFRKGDGSYQQFTEWHRIVIFRPILGQMIAGTVKKGDRVYVGGSIAYSRVQDPDSEKMFSIAQIKAEDVMVLKKQVSSVDENAPTEVEPDQPEIY